MNKTSTRLIPPVWFTVLALAGSFSGNPPALLAQQAHAPHVYVQPPTLAEEAQPTTEAVKALRFTAPKEKSPCNPQGDIRRDGNDVYVRLDYMRGKFTINNPDPDDPYGGEDPVELRSFGGCHAGPTIELLPGNTLHFDLHNNLSTDDPSCMPNPPAGLLLPPGVGCFNTVNLHTHGLHVSPAGNSDNVLLSIAPQTRFPYEINIPSDHPAGTFWYHAHNHGSTAVDAASGAAGALIIRGTRQYSKKVLPDGSHPQADIDTVLNEKPNVPMPEKLFVLQQVPYACFSNPPQQGGPWQMIFTKRGLYTTNSPSNVKDSPANSPWICPKPDGVNHASVGVIENFSLQMFSASIWDTNGRFTSINGVVQPIIEVPAGEIQRWRFIHAGIHDTVNLQVVRATHVPVNQSGKLMAAADAIAQGALKGNRIEQEAAVQAQCVATPDTLIPQFEIAVDGLTRTHMKKIGYGNDNASNYLQPGYRSDVLVVFPEDGDYCLLDQAAPKSQRFDPTTGKGGGAGPSKPQLLAYVHVRGGTPVKEELEAYIKDTLYNANPQLGDDEVRNQLKQGDLTAWAPFSKDFPAPSPSTPVQQAFFTITNQGQFQVNNTSYDPSVVNITRQVNTSDDWILSAAGEPHIYHIHVNPFEIMDVLKVEKDGKKHSIFDASGHCRADLPTDELQNQYCSLFHVFRDTVFVQDGYEVHTRTYYDRYIGEFVIHCHILDHEDAGMMLNIQIVPNLNLPGGGMVMSGMQHGAAQP